jgi:hypothetical protein
MIMSRPRQSLPQDISALVDRELSLTARLGQLVLVLVLLVTSGTIGVLGMTQPSLPVGARVTFAAILALGVLGSAFALGTWSRRRALLARQRVVGCRVAVALSAIVAIGPAILGYRTGEPAAFAVAAFGIILLGGTIALLRQAQQQLAALTARRHALAQQLEIGE